MKINTPKATNITITPEIADYLDKKLSSIEKHVDAADESAMLDVELGRTTKHHQNGDIFRAELNLFSVSGTFRAEAEAVDLYSAIDKVKDEIIRSLSARKDKRISFLRREGRRIKDVLKGIYTWRPKRFRK